MRSRSLQVAPSQNPDATDLAEPPDRILSTTYRILRDTELARRVKRMHKYKCQIQNCEYAMILPEGSPYAEAHHIQPLGGEHKGCDDMSNIMCVCPNHHAELDYGVIRIDLAKLRHAEGHSIDARFVEYHNKQIFNH